MSSVFLETIYLSWRRKRNRSKCWPTIWTGATYWLKKIPISMTRMRRESRAPMNQLVNTEQPSHPPESWAFLLHRPPRLRPTPHPHLPPRPSPWVRQITIIYRGLNVHSPTKCKFAYFPVCYNSFNAPRIHELKMYECIQAKVDVAKVDEHVFFSWYFHPY